MVPDTNRKRYTDEELHAAVLHGGEEGFGKFYDSYAPVAYGFLMHLTDDTVLAADVLVRLFLHLRLEIVGGKISASQLRPALLRKARRLARRAQLQTKEQSPLFIHNKEIPVLVGSSDSPDEERQPSASVLSSPQPSLNEQEQEVVELLYYQGLNSREAAEKLGIEEAEVRKRFRAAISYLRKLQ